MATQVIAVTGTSQTTSAIQGDKVKVVTGSASLFYRVGSAPIAYQSNCEILPSNTVSYINMQGLNNKIAFIIGSGTGNVSVTECAIIANSSVTTSVT
jgi:hypothetical protein